MLWIQGIQAAMAGAATPGTWAAGCPDLLPMPHAAQALPQAEARGLQPTGLLATLRGPSQAGATSWGPPAVWGLALGVGLLLGSSPHSGNKTLAGWEGGPGVEAKLVLRACWPSCGFSLLAPHRCVYTP